MREKTIHLESSNVIIDEIRPEFFPYVIRWRNDTTLNRYINQPYKLTPEKEKNWYENIYLNDKTQGFVVMTDRESMKPFATLGWTDYDSEKRQCILGRMILSDSGYALRLIEGTLVLMDYMYEFVDVMFAHVGINNKKALKWDMSLGFVIHEGKWEYPSESLVNGIEQCEIIRTREQYEKAKTTTARRFNLTL